MEELDVERGEITRYPLWKNVVDKVLDEIIANGHGATITHSKLNVWLDMVEPTDDVEAFKKYTLVRAGALTAAKKTLLRDHSVCFDSVHGVGYKILQPREQVDRIPEKHVDKARKNLRQAMSVLVNVKSNMLSIQEKCSKNRKIERLGFMSTATKGRLIDR